MGLFASKSDYARCRADADCRPDSGKASPRVCPSRIAGCLGAALAVLATTAQAEFRIATWHADFSEKGPGLLLRELLKDQTRYAPAIEKIADLDPDVLVLTDFDFDHGQVALAELQNRLSAAGTTFPFIFSKRPNTGLQTGLDIDGDGRIGGPRDAQGFGWFSGQGGIAVLSNVPVHLIADHSDTLWKNVSHSLIDGDDPAFDIQRLSSSSHWELGLDTEPALTLLTIAATPPVFDGPEDRNGRRNRDEVAFWLHRLAAGAPKTPVIVGNFNLDPDRGEGFREVVEEVLSHPALQDPAPGQTTVEWSGPGAMRVSYVLPSITLAVLGHGVTPPVEVVGPHRLIWVDVDVQSKPVQSPVTARQPPG